MANPTEDQLATHFVCSKCGAQGGEVHRLAMSGTGISRFLDIQPYRYAFVNCPNCGYAEVFNLRVLDKKDNVGLFLDVLFSG